MRHLACLGRSCVRWMTVRRPFSERVRFATAGLAEASSIACALPSRPRAASWHPAVDYLVESTI